MNCLRCGREKEEGNAFCSNCLLEMEKHPVSPNTVVVLPSHRSAPVRKGPLPRRPKPTQQQLLQKARRRCRNLAIATAVLSVLLAGVIAVSAWLYFRPKAAPTGQNYTAIPSGSTSMVDPTGT